jgi:hypothetical protein
MIQLTCLSRLSHYDDVWIRAIEGFLCLRSKRSGLLLSAIKLRPPHRLQVWHSARVPFNYLPTSASLEEL